MKTFYVGVVCLSIAFWSGFYTARRIAPLVSPVTYTIQIAKASFDDLSTAINAQPDSVDGHINYYKLNLVYVRALHEKMPELEKNLATTITENYAK